MYTYLGSMSLSGLSVQVLPPLQLYILIALCSVVLLRYSGFVEFSFSNISFSSLSEATL